MSADIFISFASQDRRVAMTLCSALESRGFNCWISARDIQPGENFQIAIVHAIRHAKIMLLVFTANSNNSDEMSKELALASQNKLMVVPLRIEDVAPNDAFAYEFATRQWIDFFADWEFAIQQLAARIENATRISPAALSEPPPPADPVVLTLSETPAVSDLPPSAEAKPAKAKAKRAAAEPPSFAAADAPTAETPASDDEALLKAHADAASWKRRAALYAALSVLVLAIAWVGIAMPGFLKSHSGSGELRAMSALPAAPAAKLQPVSAAPAPAPEVAAAPADDAAVKAPPKKKKAQAKVDDNDVPY